MTTYASASRLFASMANAGDDPAKVVRCVLSHWGRGLQPLLGTPLGFALERAAVRTASFRTLFLV